MQTPDKKTWSKPELIQLTGASDSAAGSSTGNLENAGLNKIYDPSPVT